MPRLGGSLTEPVSPPTGQRRVWGPIEAWGIYPVVISKCTVRMEGPSLWTGGTSLPSGLLPSSRLAQVPGLVNPVTGSPEASSLPSRTTPRVGSPWRPLHHTRKMDAESDGSTEETDESET